MSDECKECESLRGQIEGLEVKFGFDIEAEYERGYEAGFQAAIDSLKEIANRRNAKSTLD